MHHPSPHIEAFLQYLRFEKRFSRHTIEAYETDLQQFNEYLISEFETSNPESAAQGFIRSWLASLKDQGTSSRTILRKLSSLKSFYRYLVRQGVIGKSPVNNITGPRTASRLPMFVKENEMEHAMKAGVQAIEPVGFDPSKHPVYKSGWDGKTQRLIMHILYATGMRSAELLSLKDAQINRFNDTIKVLGKGNKERVLPVNKELIALIDEYVSSKRAEFGEFSDDHLLVTPTGKKLYQRKFYQLVHDCLSQITTIEKRSPHIIRHSFATHLLNNGADINSVKELLGHASLAATQVYTHNTIEKLKEAYNKAHPKA